MQDTQKTVSSPDIGQPLKIKGLDNPLDWVASIVQLVSLVRFPELFRGGVWPVAVGSIPGPKYFPALPAETGGHKSAEHGVGFPKEERFLSNATR